MEGRNGRLKKARVERKRQGRNGRGKEEKEIRKEGGKEEREGFLCPRIGRAWLVRSFLLSLSSFPFFLPSSLPSFSSFSLPFLSSLHSLLLSFPRSLHFLFPDVLIFSFLFSSIGGEGAGGLESELGVGQVPYLDHDKLGFPCWARKRAYGEGGGGGWRFTPLSDHFRARLSCLN